MLFQYGTQTWGMLNSRRFLDGFRFFWNLGANSLSAIAKF